MNRGIMVTRDDPGIDELVFSARLLHSRCILSKCKLLNGFLHLEEFVHQMVVVKCVGDWSVSSFHLLKHIMKYVKSKLTTVKNFLAFVTFTGELT